MNKKNFLKVTTYAAVFGLIGGMSFEGVSYVADRYINNNTAIEKTITAEEKTPDSSVKIDTASTLNSTYTSSDAADGVSEVVENVLLSIPRQVQIYLEEPMSRIPLEAVQA